MSAVLVTLLVVIIVLLIVVIYKLGEQNDLKKDMAQAYRALAMSLAREAKSTLKDVAQAVDKGKQEVTAVVEKGVQAAATLAANIVVPPSGDKIPRPVLPDG